MYFQLFRLLEVTARHRQETEIETERLRNSQVCRTSFDNLSMNILLRIYKAPNSFNLHYNFSLKWRRC